MSTLQEQLDAVLPTLRAAGTDLQHVEVKDGSGGFPPTVLKSVSAFANGSGGLLVLGLSEPDFTTTGIDARQTASTLASKCSDSLQPPIRPEIGLCEVDGALVVVAAVDEIDADAKPCFVKESGHPLHAYIRTHDGNRRLTAYEHHAVLAAKGQPTDDEQPVNGTGLEDLDQQMLARLLDRIRTTRGPIFQTASDTECLRLLGVLTDTPDGEALTLAGLLALGRYPQQHAPRLNLTFVAFPTENGAPLADGTRYLDSQPIEGPVPAMIESAADALRRNMRRRGVVIGLGREDHWDYPLEAVREVVVNALMHRDYHPSARGQPVMMALYPDRLEITSPGGLYGAFDPDRLMTEPVTAARNARLAKLLQDVQAPTSGRAVCENVGTGLVSTARYLRDAGLSPPEIEHTLSDFKVVFRNHTVLDHEAVAWLATLHAGGLNDRQRLGLAHARRHDQIDNRGYRVLTGCDGGTATQELTDLRRQGLLERTGGRRWAAWRLRERPPAPEPLGNESEGASPGRRPPNAAADPRDPADTGPLPVAQVEVSRIAATRLTSRHRQVLDLLGDRPATSAQLADSLGVTRGAVLNWLRRLEEHGLAHTTQPGRRSRNQTWARTRPKPNGQDE